MEATTEQALQQVVAVHKEGKLQEAEKFYRAILRSQSLHPDANHNLGVIVVTINKADAALPIFKMALKANPEVEQFGLRYIDAHIKKSSFKVQSKLFIRGKSRGGSREVKFFRRATSLHEQKKKY